MPGRQENMIFERKSSANPLLCPAPPLDAPVAPRAIAGSTTPSRRIHSPSPKLLPVRHMWDRGGGGKATPKPRHRVVEHRYRHIRPLHRAPPLERGEVGWCDWISERERERGVRKTLDLKRVGGRGRNSGGGVGGGGGRGGARERRVGGGRCNDSGRTWWRRGSWVRAVTDLLPNRVTAGCGYCHPWGRRRRQARSSS